MNTVRAVCPSSSFTWKYILMYSWLKSPVMAARVVSKTLPMTLPGSSLGVSPTLVSPK